MQFISNDNQQHYVQTTQKVATIESHSMAALCLCRLGSSMTMVNSMITTIHEMEHHIRTTFGDLKSHASCYTWQALITGIGQVNGASPQIWAAVSSPMLDIMQMASFYTHLMTAITRMDKRLVGFAFIDDMDLCVYGPHITSLNVWQEMQWLVNHWEGLLRLLVEHWYQPNASGTWSISSKTTTPGNMLPKMKNQEKLR